MLVMKICKECGKVFNYNGRPQDVRRVMYCSNSCKNKHKYRENKHLGKRKKLEKAAIITTVNKCAECGKDFVVIGNKINARKSYCSDECHNEKRRKEKKDKRRKEENYYDKYCKKYRQREEVKSKRREQAKRRVMRKAERSGRTYRSREDIAAESMARQALAPKKAKLVLSPEEKIERSRKLARDKYREMMESQSFRLNGRMRNAIRKSLKGGKNGRRWESLVGYSLKQLMKHIEKRFAPGMSWDNFGEWHIDHIIPKSLFNYSSVEDIDFKRCWALKNLQPLWAEENIRKHNHYDKPFQPSLMISD